MSTINSVKLSENGDTYAITLPFLADGFTAVDGNNTLGSYLATKLSVPSINGITIPVDGMTIVLRVPAAGTYGGIVLSIDGGTSYYPIVRNVDSMVTDACDVGSVLILTFNTAQTAKSYLTAGKSSTITGCWQVVDYDMDKSITKQIRNVESTINGIHNYGTFLFQNAIATFAGAPTTDGTSELSADTYNGIIKFIAGNNLINFECVDNTGTDEVTITINADPAGSADDALENAISYTDGHIGDSTHLVDGDRKILDSNLITADTVDTIQMYSVTFTGSNIDRISNMSNKNTTVLNGGGYINTIFSSRNISAFNVTMGGSTLSDNNARINDNYSAIINIPEVTGDIVINIDITNEVTEPS